MQRNPCCERAQHKSGTSGVGSLQTFAADYTNVCSADFAAIRKLAPEGRSQPEADMMRRGTATHGFSRAGGKQTFAASLKKQLLLSQSGHVYLIYLLRRKATE